MAVRPHAPRAGPHVLSRLPHRSAAALAAALASAAVAASIASAVEAPAPARIAAGPFPAAVATVTRPEPPLLDVLSDVGHPVRSEPDRTLPAGAWVPRTIGTGALRRVIPQGTLGFALYGDDFASERYLVGLDLRRQRVRYALDLGSLTRAPAATPADREFVYAGIAWVREADGVLYVSNTHSTYARSSKGRNAAVTAIDLDRRRVLWRSPSLVANAGTFVLAPGDRLVTGYGFTAEPDYVFVLDRATGRILDRVPVADGPETITRRGTEIRVETYTRSLVLRLRG